MERKLIPVSEPNLGLSERKALLKAFDSSWISSKGHYINEFESKFSKYVGSKNSITTSNGTVALHLILKALGIGPKDEVIVPTFTYIASVNAINYVGAKPVFVDSEEDTWNLKINEVKRKITSRTKAIIGVHIYGHSFDIEPLLEICDDNEILLVEDAAEALGTTYKGKHVGTFGIAGSFSFYGNKTITCGEGGMVVTNDDLLANTIKKLRNQGSSTEKRYWHEVIGYNYRMTNLQAAIGSAQIDRMNEFVEKKRKIASWYKKYLVNDCINHPVDKDYNRNSFWMYSILLSGFLKSKREELSKYLRKNYYVETRPFFYPAHILPMYQKITNERFSNVESFYYRGLCLPSSTKLTEKDIIYISRSVLNTIDYLKK